MPAPLAIVMSGGGAKGAFQVGVLEELILNRGVEVDIFCGVSTGSIQALGGAQNDIAGLKEQWLALRKNSDVYNIRPFRTLGGLLGANSIYDAKPIRERIVKFASPAKLRKSGKKLMLGVVNLQDGKFRVIHEDTPRIGDWVYASCAMPYFFQPMKDASGGQWVDGGVRNITPLAAAMEWNPRAALTVMASPIEKEAEAIKSYKNLLTIALRSVGILTSEVYENDFANAEMINDFIKARADQANLLKDAGISGSRFRKIMAPIDTCIGDYRFTKIGFIAPEKEVSETLKFDHDTIVKAMEAGRQAVAKDWTKISALIA